MTVNDLKLLCFYLSRTYVILAVAYCVYLWTVAQTHPASIRTAIALLAFAVITLLPERFCRTVISEKLMMAFGVIGTSILLAVTVSQATP